MSGRTTRFIVTIVILLAIAFVLWITQIKNPPTQQSLGPMKGETTQTVQPTATSTAESKTQGTKKEEKKSPEQIEYEKIRQLFVDGELEKAIEELTRFIEKNPKSEWADDAQFDIAQCYEHMGEKEKAVKEYQKLVDKYPKSDLVNSAQYAIDLLEGRTSYY
ncbi:MAG: tetratricopeptide repeat protein [bacterium]|nr:tetratricopeptide repeat protein [bacterium]